MTTPGIPRIDWKAERDAMRAPAYFARVTSYDVDRGMDPEERAARAVKRQEYRAGKEGTSDGIDMD